MAVVFIALLLGVVLGGDSLCSLDKQVSFSCDDDLATIQAKGVACVHFNGYDVCNGYVQKSKDNKDPRTIGFKGGKKIWCLSDYETTGADGTGRGVFFNPHSNRLYGVYTTDGTQGSESQDYRRFSKQGWMRHYTDGSPRGGGGKTAQVLVELDVETGKGLKGTFITAMLSSQKVNSVGAVKAVGFLDQNVVVGLSSSWSPRMSNSKGERLICGEDEKVPYYDENKLWNWELTFDGDLSKVVYSTAPACKDSEPDTKKGVLKNVPRPKVEYVQSCGDADGVEAHKWDFDARVVDPKADACSHSVCMNKGTCHVDAGTPYGYTCACTAKWTGQHCTLEKEAANAWKDELKADLNQCRADVTQVVLPAVAWDGNLEKLATEEAAKLCKDESAVLATKTAGGKFVGTTKWVKDGSYSQPSDWARSVTGEWCHQRDSLTVQEKGGEYVFTCAEKEVCKDYTQVIWEASTEVGCGFAVCGAHKQAWVCKWSAPGNMARQTPFYKFQVRDASVMQRLGYSLRTSPATGVAVGVLCGVALSSMVAAIVVLVRRRRALEESVEEAAEELL